MVKYGTLYAEFSGTKHLCMRRTGTKQRKFLFCKKLLSDIIIQAN